MNKRLIAAIALFISAFAITGFARKAFLRETSLLSDSIYAVIEASQNGSDNELNDKINALQKQWRHSGKILHILVNHGEMDEAEQNITAMAETVEFTGRDELRLRCIDALNQIKNLRQSEKLNFENIL